MIVKVNAVGKQCPHPVIEAKKAIEELKGKGIVEVSVDNEIAVQNLKKLAAHKKLESSDEKINNDLYVVKITVDGEEDKDKFDQDEFSPVPDALKKNTVVVLGSNTMGTGSDELGKILMKGFVFALTKQESLPKTVLLYNSGVKLASEGSDSIADLLVLEEEGVEILACGTCLNYYELSDKLKVGHVTNMYEIVEKMTEAGLIVRP
ncbi:MAG: sulfurtransferase-like selenium metabolism protein YedF [Clostridiaceae bacterium]